MEILWFVVVVLVAWLLVALYRRKKRGILIREIQEKAERVRSIVQQSFLVQPCSRCHEFAMQLIQVSPNARSVQYRCVHCGKKMHAAAVTPDSTQITAVWSALSDFVSQYNDITSSSPISFVVDFETASAPLPYEQTSRSPLPEAVRSEVWRRRTVRGVRLARELAF